MQATRQMNAHKGIGTTAKALALATGVALISAFAYRGSLLDLPANIAAKIKPHATVEFKFWLHNAPHDAKGLGSFERFSPLEDSAALNEYGLIARGYERDVKSGVLDSGRVSLSRYGWFGKVKSETITKVASADASGLMHR